MTSHRSRFLASLSERLQSDLASRELDSDDSNPLPGPEPAGQTARYEPSEQFAGEGFGDPSTARAAQLEAERDAASEAVAAPGPVAPILESAHGEGELTQHGPVPWSEAGMPVRLREAIASVRRVSSEMHEAATGDHAMHGPAPFEDDADRDVQSLADDAVDEEPPPHDRLTPLEDDAGPDDWQTGFHRHALHERPPDDELALLDERAPFQHEQPIFNDDAGYDQPQAADELVLRGDDALDDDGRIGFAADAEHGNLPPDDALMRLEDDPAYQHERVRRHGDGEYDEQAPVDEAAYRAMEPDDRAAQEWASGREDPGDRLPLWRRAKRRYGLHAAAFAVAIAFVALAGFGLGILSGDGTVVAPLMRDSTRAAAPTEPTHLSTGRSTPVAEREPPAELSELVTVRVRPAPVAAAPEPARPTVSAPLPPPRKPALPQFAATEAAPAATVRAAPAIPNEAAPAATGRAAPATPNEAAPATPNEAAQATTDEAAPAATGEATAADRQLAGVVADAAAALLEAEGAGGPFQPLFTKLPLARPPETRVLVHYSASAVGAPATAMHLVRHLKAEGFAVEARPVDFSIPTNSIRYFFDADREQAEALRSRLEGQVPGGSALNVIDFRSYEPKPRPGLIEVWLRA